MIGRIDNMGSVVTVCWNATSETLDAGGQKLRAPQIRG
jgi:hypothetical protein